MPPAVSTRPQNLDGISRTPPTSSTRRFKLHRCGEGTYAEIDTDDYEASNILQHKTDLRP
eukprot:3326461-Pyramimonas_sp.AAC.1